LLLSVAQDTELLPRTPDSQAVSRKLLERAQSYFEALLKEYRGNPQLTFELARAHVGLAQIAQRLGDTGRVHHEVSEALKWTERIPSGRVASTQVDALRGEALLTLGNAQLEAGEAKLAVSTLGDAVAACRHGAPTPPADSRERLWSVEGLALRALAEAETTIGRHDAARGHLAEARERFQQLVAHYPGEPSHVRDAALVDMSLSTMAIDRGDVDEGKQYLLSAAALLNKTGNALGHSLRIRELLGIIQINLGLAESRMGHTSESEQAFRTAIAEFRRLADLEPAVHSHKWKLVTASLNIGGPMLEQGRHEEVVALWKEIVPVLDQLIEAQPESQRYVQVKAMLQSNIAIVLRDRGQAEEAIEPLTNATRILREQSRRVDDAPEAYLPVALNYSELATTYLVLERWAEALQALDRSDAICRELLEAHPDFESARGQWLDNMFARYKALQGKSPEDGRALVELTDQAVELARTLVSRQPEMVEYQVELPLALIMRGEVRLAQSDLQRAYTDGKTAIAHLTKRFQSPWTGRPRQAYRDASLLMARIVAREITAATNEATRKAKRDELQQWLTQARKMGATNEEIQQIESDGSRPE
ncbi:MAG TPA: tetratricopeptide repeat protein, partial [Planctomycetaceae bacterium]|nr:tetratricopeptide repeat protein [Planctomycetaceae bacterium]